MSECCSRTNITTKEVLKIEEKLNSVLGPYGFEVHSFKVGWYNDQVDKKFKLHYNEDVIAFLINSLPEMFENGFIPFLSSGNFFDLQKYDLELTAQDPIDECMAHFFKILQMTFKEHSVKTIHDFEMYPNRRPKVLVQTAGHVSGAAYYYQMTDVKNPPWDKTKRLFGVSIHPKYGGWFALRGVAIFEDLMCSMLQQKSPVDILHSDELKIKVLEEFNYRWKSWNYRDIIPVLQKYSEKQKLYFITKPADRLSLLSSIIKDCAIT